MSVPLPAHPSAAPGAHVPRWLVDHYLEGYIRWREESAAARRAYEIWHTAERQDRALAFAAYGAALDREESAASLLRARVELVHRRCK